MKKLILLCLYFVSLFLLSCKKDKIGSQGITLKVDGQLTEGVADNPAGYGLGYSICTTSDCYAGYGGGYSVGTSANIQITLGQIKSPQGQLSFEDFKSLFKPGARQFDSLMVLGQLNSDRVEVQYIERSGKRWSTTKEYYDTGGNLVRIINQPASSFVVDEVEEVKVDGRVGGVKFAGRFNCILYERGGNGQKIITDATFITKVTMH